MHLRCALCAVRTNLEPKDSTMRFKKEYLILLVVIVGLSLYLWQDKSGRMHYELPELKQLASKKLTRVDIKRPDGELLLQKKQGKWLVGERGYTADENKVSNILNTIAELSLSALVSQSEAYSRYGLDEEQQIFVTAFENGTAVRELRVGKASPNRSGAYVRVQDDPNVYLAEQNLKLTLDQTVQRLRDKTVLGFNRDKATQVALAKGSKRLVLKKQSLAKGEEQQAEKQAQAWTRADGKDLGSPKDIEELLSQLSNLQCTKYLAENATLQGAAKEYSLQVKTEKEHRLTLYRFAPENSDEDEGEKNVQYRGTSSDSASPFRLSKYRAERLTKLIDPLFEDN